MNGEKTTRIFISCTFVAGKRKFAIGTEISICAIYRKGAIAESTVLK